METIEAIKNKKVSLLHQKMADYKRAAVEIQADLTAYEPIDKDLYHTFYSKAMAIIYLSHEILGEYSDLSMTEKEEIGTMVQREILPFILQTDTVSRFYTKPLGYAGDYMVLEKIYNDVESGSTPLGKAIDRMHLDATTSIAVRNRRKLMANELFAAFQNRTSDPLSILCISSGSAREIFDLMNKTGKEAFNVHATLIDFDQHAIDFCRKWRDENGWQNQIDLVQETILNVMTRRTTVHIPPQDIVYSIGLIDYFQEKHVVKLLDYIYSILKTNGKVILGNFYKGNIYKEYMDFVLEWKLVHRNEADMIRMVQQSKFGQSSRIFFEGTGLNMFVECVKV